MIRNGAALAIGAVLAACASSPTSSGPSATPPPPAVLAGTSWRVQELAGEAVPADAEGTLEFPEAGRVAGRAFCNRFSGQVRISGSSMQIGPLAVTKMACREPAMGLESRFLNALQKAERLTLDGSTLLLYFAGSDQPLRFSRRPAS